MSNTNTPSNPPVLYFPLAPDREVAVRLVVRERQDAAGGANEREPTLVETIEACRAILGSPLENLRTETTLERQTV